MRDRIIYIVLGCVFLCTTGLFIFIFIKTDDFQPMGFYSQAMLLVMCCCMAYLSPQMKQQDERFKLIREKGMFYSYFAIVVYLIGLMWLIQFDVIAISAIHVVMLLAFLISSTVFITMVVVSKIY